MSADPSGLAAPAVPAVPAVPAQTGAALAGAAAYDLVVVVGTDHHRFDRVVRWTDDVVAATPGLRAYVQHGHAAAPGRADGSALLPHALLQERLRRARAVVSHGGPATISEIRRLGRLPVVVPRDPSLGEHVDAHQQRFAGRWAAAGLVVRAVDPAACAAAVADALARPERYAVAAQDEAERIARTVAHYGAVFDAVIAASRSPR